MTKSFLRGHPIYAIDGVWFYEDTKTPTAGNPRACSDCDKSDRDDGHDACLGRLPTVMNACCGHGQTYEAYIQFNNGRRLSGENALGEFQRLKAV